jgi:benzoylformate decarboxylase
MPDYLASDLLLEQLLAEGTEIVFGTPRAQDSALVTAIEHRKQEIQYVQCLHENIASAQAIGYAQAAGKAGVVCLPSGPGLISALTSAYNARLMRVPLVILTEQPDLEILNDEPPLSADIVRLSAPLCKWSCQLNAVPELSRLIRRAFHEALSAPKGPIVLSLPINLLNTQCALKTVPVPHASPLGGADGMFLRKVVDKLVQSRSPCIIAGNEVSLYRARTEVIALAEVVGCPVFIEPLPTGVNFSNRHHLFASVLPPDAARASSLLKHFDLFLVLGMQTRPASRSFEPPFIPPTGTVLQINIEPDLQGRGLPNDLSATADIKESLSRLRTEIQLTASSAWINAAKERQERTRGAISASKSAYEDGLKFPNHAAKISMPWLLRTVESTRPNRSVIVNDLCASEPHVMESLAFEHSFAYFASNSGVLGYGPAAAAGILFASPNSTVICLTDDQSMLAYPQVLWTAALYDLNVKFVVLNTFGRKTFNLCLTRQNNTVHKGLQSLPVQFADLGKSYGVGHSFSEDMKTLEKNLKSAFENRGPQLLEVAVDIPG